ncbi:MAG: transposase-like protein [Thermoproteota archaeon]|jgi:transposase-like protein
MKTRGRYSTSCEPQRPIGLVALIDRVPDRRNIAAALKFFTLAFIARGEPGEVVADLAPALESAIELVLPDASTQQR